MLKRGQTWSDFNFPQTRFRYHNRPIAETLPNLKISSSCVFKVNKVTSALDRFYLSPIHVLKAPKASQLLTVRRYSLTSRAQEQNSVDRNVDMYICMCVCTNQLVYK